MSTADRLLAVNALCGGMPSQGKSGGAWFVLLVRTRAGRELCGWSRDSAEIIDTRTELEQRRPDITVLPGSAATVRGTAVDTITTLLP